MKTGNRWGGGVILAAVVASSPVAAQDSLEGEWRGMVAFDGRDIEISVHFARGYDGYAVSVHAPMLSLERRNALIVVYDAPVLHVELPADAQPIVFDGERRGEAIAGMFHVGDRSGALLLLRFDGVVEVTAAER